MRSAPKTKLEAQRMHEEIRAFRRSLGDSERGGARREVGVATGF